MGAVVTRLRGQVTFAGGGIGGDGHGDNDKENGDKGHRRSVLELICNGVGILLARYVNYGCVSLQEELVSIQHFAVCQLRGH
jgi:hypothetical protein